MLLRLAPFRNRKDEYLATAPPPGPAPLPGMVWVPGGDFLMGSNLFYPEEKPVRRVQVPGFWMDQNPVTNREFKAFVATTGYVTVPERADAGEERHGLAFRRPKAKVPLSDPRAWWRIDPDASWNVPRGPSEGRAKPNHPVVQVTYHDAAAYARWAGKQIPTEAEWEFAARGGLDGAVFAWGNDELGTGRKRMANTWQGEFPHHNTMDDGFLYTSPAGTFPPNGYGLSDMIGNVWEWTSDTMEGDQNGCCVPGAVSIERKHVIKGGSHLCAPNYCFRYRPSARSSQMADTSTSHIGFRCISRST